MKLKKPFTETFKILKIIFGVKLWIVEMIYRGWNFDWVKWNQTYLQKEMQHDDQTRLNNMVYTKQIAKTHP